MRYASIHEKRFPMKEIELTAASEDEARTKAAAELGVDEDDVTIKVIEETAGLFGKPGKVKVKAKAKAAKKTTRAKKKDEEPEAEAEEKPKKPARGRAKKKDEEPEEKKESKSDKKEEDEREPVVATQEDGDTITDIFNDIFEAGPLEVEAKLLSVHDRYAEISMDGKDAGFLVGRRGEVLNAMQYLGNVISARTLDNGVRVTMNADGYRERREETLTKLATQIAEQVRERGEEAVLDALPAFERRVIHRALLEEEGIETYSEGEEPERCVVIAPSE